MYRNYHQAINYQAEGWSPLHIMVHEAKTEEDFAKIIHYLEDHRDAYKYINQHLRKGTYSGYRVLKILAENPYASGDAAIFLIEMLVMLGADLGINCRHDGRVIYCEEQLLREKGLKFRKAIENGTAKRLAALSKLNESMSHLSVAEVLNKLDEINATLHTSHYYPRESYSDDLKKLKSPLEMAIELERIDLLAGFIEKNKSLLGQQCSDGGNNPLDHAVYYLKPRSAKFLLDMYLNSNNGWLKYTAENASHHLFYGFKRICHQHFNENFMMSQEVQDAKQRFIEIYHNFVNRGIPGSVINNSKRWDDMPVESIPYIIFSEETSDLKMRDFQKSLVTTRLSRITKKNKQLTFMKDKLIAGCVYLLLKEDSEFNELDAEAIQRIHQIIETVSKINNIDVFDNLERYLKDNENRLLLMEALNIPLDVIVDHNFDGDTALHATLRCWVEFLKSPHGKADLRTIVTAFTALGIDSDCNVKSNGFGRLTIRDQLQMISWDIVFATQLILIADTQTLLREQNGSHRQHEELKDTLQALTKENHELVKSLEEAQAELARLRLENSPQQNLAHQDDAESSDSEDDTAYTDEVESDQEIEIHDQLPHQEGNQAPVILEPPAAPKAPGITRPSAMDLSMAKGALKAVQRPELPKSAPKKVVPKQGAPKQAVSKQVNQLAAQEVEAPVKVTSIPRPPVADLLTAKSALKAAQPLQSQPVVPKQQHKVAFAPPKTQPPAVAKRPSPAEILAKHSLLRPVKQQIPQQDAKNGGNDAMRNHPMLDKVM